MNINNNVGIEAIEYHLPPEIITAKELSERFGFDAEFIENKIGVRQLYTAGDQTVSDLAVNALEKLLDRKPGLRDNIDLLVLCTQTPDFSLPQTSTQIQARCNLPLTLASFDISLGCSGFVYGISVVEALLRLHGYDNAVLITADTYSHIIDPNDRNTKCLFSDAAAATLISRNGVLESGKFRFGTNGELFDRLIVKKEPSEDGPARLYMDGRAIFNFTASVIPEEIDEVCSINGLDKNSIDYFVFHQASKFVLDTIAKKSGIEDSERLVKYISRFGNTVSSSIPIALKELLNEKGEAGLNILISGFGVGLSWATTVIYTKGNSNNV